MIIRILAEGQYDVPDSELDALNEFDGKLEQAIEQTDETVFRMALAALLSHVRSTGTQVALDALVASDLVLPHADADLGEVRDMLSDDGLIPG